MPKYTISISETLIRKYKFEAENMEEAERIAQEKYFNGDFSRTPDEVISEDVYAEEDDYYDDDEDDLCF